MARNSREERREDAADEAINKVLAAEHDAVAAITRAEHEGESLIAQTRLRARRIEERADARSSTLRARCRAWTAAEVAKRRAEAEEVLACPVESDERRHKLRAAVAQLAAELTGGDQ